MPATVLDSFALIAYFRGEPAGVPVKELLRKAGEADKPVHRTEVNYAEANYMILRKDGAGAWAEAARILIVLPIELHPADRELADVATDFKSRFSLSLADAFAAALAKKHKAELVTGDPEFKTVEKGIKIDWIRCPQPFLHQVDIRPPHPGTVPSSASTTRKRSSLPSISGEAGWGSRCTSDEQRLSELTWV